MDGDRSRGSAVVRDRRPPRRVCRGRTCPRTARQPYRAAPARSRRRWAARRPPWPRSAASRARTRWPPSAPRGGAHRCAAQAAPAPGARMSAESVPGRWLIRSRKVDAQSGSRAKVGWGWRRVPSATRSEQPGRPPSPQRRSRSLQRPGRGAQTAKIAAAERRGGSGAAPSLQRGI